MLLLDLPPHILIFGCGNMGGAILRGWLAAGVAPDRFTVVDPVATGLPQGVKLHRSAGEIERRFDTVLLGIKPQMLGALARDIEGLLSPDATLISILAGTRSATLKSFFPGAKIIRLMPNLAAAIGKSPLGLFSDTADVPAMEALLEPLGTPVWLDDEDLMDAVTALAGSGPALVYRFIDALAQGGTAVGLPRYVATKLALAMTEGAAMLAATSPESPYELAARVTSPGGTTAAGLEILDKDDALGRLIEATLCAARDRGAALAGEVPE
jgi:pyrroline-5-carboxylate reductase